MVRRVQEVIENPVKDEGVEEELDAERLPDAGVGHPTSMPTCGGDARQRMSRAGSHQRRGVPSDHVDEQEEATTRQCSRLLQNGRMLEHITWFVK